VARQDVQIIAALLLTYKLMPAKKAYAWQLNNEDSKASLHELLLGLVREGIIEQRDLKKFLSLELDTYIVCPSCRRAVKKEKARGVCPYCKQPISAGNARAEQDSSEASESQQPAIFESELNLGDAALVDEDDANFAQDEYLEKFLEEKNDVSLAFEDELEETQEPISEELESIEEDVEKDEASEKNAKILESAEHKPDFDESYDSTLTEDTLIFNFRVPVRDFARSDASFIALFRARFFRLNFVFSIFFLAVLVFALNFFLKPKPPDKSNFLTERSKLEIQIKSADKAVNRKKSKQKKIRTEIENLVEKKQALEAQLSERENIERKYNAKKAQYLGKLLKLEAAKSLLGGLVCEALGKDIVELRQKQFADAELKNLREHLAQLDNASDEAKQIATQLKTLNAEKAELARQISQLNKERKSAKKRYDELCTLIAAPPPSVAFPAWAFFVIFAAAAIFSAFAGIRTSVSEFYASTANTQLKARQKILLALKIFAEFAFLAFLGLLFTTGVAGAVFALILALVVSFLLIYANTLLIVKTESKLCFSSLLKLKFAKNIATNLLFLALVLSAILAAILAGMLINSLTAYSYISVLFVVLLLICFVLFEALLGIIAGLNALICANSQE